jgi:aspartate/methionine/tyrosine aminotransferase
MTGWRAGWMVVPEELADDLAKLIEYNFSCVFEPVQRAAVAALAQGEPDVARLRTELQSTRRVLASAARPARCGGARGRRRDVRLLPPGRLCRFAGPGQAPGGRGGPGPGPGAAFGPEGDGWLRWCHAVSDPQKLLAGVDRLASFVARHRPG